MRDKSNFLCNLLYIVIVLLNLCTIISGQATARANSINYNIAEGGSVPEVIDNTFSRKLNNTTLPTALNHTKESKHSIPTKVDNSHVSKQIEKPFNAEKTAKVETISRNVTPTLPVITVQNATKHEQVPKSSIPTKPQITEHDDNPEKPDIKLNGHMQKLSSIDALKKKNNRANYVIPIVAVILSIPLVAIIISVVYKRGADWWQHRNYRRMDFLIEGMYNN